MSKYRKSIYLAFKGFAMGAANVIPGVSGGTIALVTGIYQELIDSLKSFDKIAFVLLFKGKFKEFTTRINLSFFISLGIGIILSIFSIAKLFDWLLKFYPTYIWAFFFGLILASVFFVGKTVEKWTWKEISFLIFGALVAIILSFTNPAPQANENYFFIFLCGMVGISGMLLPGLSGSYILMLLGNYKLLMVDSINNLAEIIGLILALDFSFILNIEMMQNLNYFLLFLGGSIFGMLCFSQVISWIFHRYKNVTISMLTGFVFGSLAIIWPWKNEITNSNLINRHGKEVVVGYNRYFPATFDYSLCITLSCLFIGVLCIWSIEKLSKEKSK
ncbi:MAG: DUF368 domain-containing protein [Flavobacteriales bacterium]|nr:DUF368 domain-containing protein [Flavobacteriales bacterium]|tara:strand:- start:1700 stop:2692 length:993 start_codon:yes stop_codon:yes gene_type:complete